MVHIARTEGVVGRVSHSSTFQLKLSRFCPKEQLEHPLIPLNTAKTTPQHSLNNP